MNSDNSEADIGPGQLLAELRIYPPADLPGPAEPVDDANGRLPRVTGTKPPSKMVERTAPPAPAPVVAPTALATVAPPTVAPPTVAPPTAPPVTPPVRSPVAPTTASGLPPTAPPVAAPTSAPAVESKVAVVGAPSSSSAGATASPPAPVSRIVPVTPPARVALDPADEVLEIEDGETTLFEAAIGAFHAGEFQRAESLFLEEAERSLDSAPQRAAIAFRQAALAARQGGNADGSDHWMRLAGREYLKVSEDDRTPLPYIREAALMAAKCFLSVENLQVASKGLRRAQAIDSVLRADDDLLASVPDIPFRHGDTAPTPVVPTLSSPPNASRSRPRPSGPLPDPGAQPLHRGRWLPHLKLGRPSHGMV